MLSTKQKQGLVLGKYVYCLQTEAWGINCLAFLIRPAWGLRDSSEAETGIKRIVETKWPYKSKWRFYVWIHCMALEDHFPNSRIRSQRETEGSHSKCPLLEREPRGGFMNTRMMSSFTGLILTLQSIWWQQSVYKTEKILKFLMENNQLLLVSKLTVQHAVH